MPDVLIPIAWNHGVQSNHNIIHLVPIRFQQLASFMITNCDWKMLRIQGQPPNNGVSLGIVRRGGNRFWWGVRYIPACCDGNLCRSRHLESKCLLGILILYLILDVSTRATKFTWFLFYTKRLCLSPCLTSSYWKAQPFLIHDNLRTTSDATVPHDVPLLLFYRAKFPPSARRLSLTDEPRIL